MMQGDAYSVPVVIKAKDGTVITPEMATRVEITIGHLTRQWPGVITFNEDTLAWEFPLTQQQSFCLSQGKQKTQVRVAFSNGWVVGGDGTDVHVLKSESKSILPAAAQQEKAANIVFGAIFAEIGAITVVLGAGLPEMSSATKGQYLTNDGETAGWANVDALPAMSSDTAGKMLTNDGKNPKWGGAVRYDEQTLTADEQAQARKNIGAGTPYTLPIASPTQLGGVKPVAKTDAMTKNVGVDSDGGLYAEPAAWYVTVTQTSADSYSASADKTPQEVFNAYQAGYAVYARFASVYDEYLRMLPLVVAKADDGNIFLQFFKTVQLASGDPPTFICVFYINTDWSFETIQLVDDTNIPYQNPLGITGAQVGQIAKITAVGTDGKPTAWEAVDMQGGGEEWELINEITIAGGAEESNALTIDKDLNGQPFSLKHAILYAHFPAYTGESTIRDYGFAMLNGKVSGNVTGIPLAYTSLWPKLSTTLAKGCAWNVTVDGALRREIVISGENLGKLNDVGERIWNTYNPVTTKTQTYYATPNNVESIISIGGTSMLIYPGCYFKLIGVRV